MASDPFYPAFPVICFIGFVLVLIPLPWHLQAWNSGTCLFIIWTAIASLNLFVNSIVWHSSVINFAPVWCDISTRIIIAGAVAIPASSLCINRRLCVIASVKTVSITRAEKQRAIFVDLCIGVGLPLLEIALAYVVTGHRFDIYEGLGCQPAVYVTPLTFPLVLCWPLAIGLVSAIYCVFTLRAFLKRRAQFKELLAAHPALTVNRYFRLMALACVELLCTVPLSAYGIYLNSDGGVNPWISWANVHYDYSRVGLYPAVLWRSDHLAVVSFELSRWLVPFCALVFFAFFGLASEAQKHYRQASLFLLRQVRLSSWVHHPHSRPADVKISELKTTVLQLPSPQSPPPPFTESSAVFSDSGSEKIHCSFVETPTHDKFVRFSSEGSLPDSAHGVSIIHNGSIV